MNNYDNFTVELKKIKAFFEQVSLTRGLDNFNLFHTVVIFDFVRELLVVPAKSI